jgi:hypothetical protein
MRRYLFSPDDQDWNNWLLFVEKDDEPLQVKPKYRTLVCPECLQYDRDKVFRRGFDSELRIRARGDIFQTADGFYCVNERLRGIFQKHRIQGMKLKKLGKGGWYVVSLTLRVNADRRVYKTEKDLDGRKFCPLCKRALSVYGIFEFEKQIDSPKAARALFTTVFDREGVHSSPDLLITDDVVKILKEAKIKGGSCDRLWTDEEARTVAAKEKAGAEWRPPGTLILLNGK